MPGHIMATSTRSGQQCDAIEIRRDHDLALICVISAALGREKCFSCLSSNGCE